MYYLIIHPNDVTNRPDDIPIYPHTALNAYWKQRNTLYRYKEVKKLKCWTKSCANLVLTRYVSQQKEWHFSHFHWEWLKVRGRKALWNRWMPPGKGTKVWLMHIIWVNSFRHTQISRFECLFVRCIRINTSECSSVDYVWIFAAETSRDTPNCAFTVYLTPSMTLGSFATRYCDQDFSLPDYNPPQRSTSSYRFT